MVPVWSKQPFKLLYITFFLLRLPLTVAFLLARYSLKQFRPLPTWGLRVCLVNALTKEYFQLVTATRSNGLNLVQSGHSKAGERFAWAAPAKEYIYSGILASDTVKPAPVGGLWYPDAIHQKSTDVGNEKIVLHFPGGAFVLAFGYDSIGQDVANTMSKYMKATRTFLPQYRPASSPDTRFPAAIQDLLTSYHYILSLGVEPRNIILSGDSAAGNLVIALLRHLETASQLPLPGGVMAWSPWTYVTPEASRDYDQCNNSQGDMLIGSLLQWGVDAYLPETRSRESVPYISPLHHPFKTKVPLFLQAGSGEALYDSVKSFAQEMAEVADNRIRFHSADLAPHGLILAHKSLGMTAHMQDAVESAHRFFEEEA